MPRKLPWNLATEENGPKGTYKRASQQSSHRGLTGHHIAPAQAVSRSGFERGETVAFAVRVGILVDMSQALPVATQAETIYELLERSKRTAVPIRKTFVQQGTGKVRQPGPLGRLLKHRDDRALDLYLLVHAAASGDPFDITLPAAVWVRAAGLKQSPSALSTVSKAFRRIDAAGLITRKRVGGRSKLTLLDESGTGLPYARPSGKTDTYLKLAHEYWTSDWFRRLGSPAKVMLLIALSLDDGFYLPLEKGPDWYGISSDTVGRGFGELVKHGLLTYEDKQKKAPLSPQGYTTTRSYQLNPPFGPVRSQHPTKQRASSKP